MEITSFLYVALIDAAPDADSWPFAELVSNMLSDSEQLGCKLHV